MQLQQYLPFTVLKPLDDAIKACDSALVATVLTVYGIETYIWSTDGSVCKKVATVLTVYGIETKAHNLDPMIFRLSCNSTYRLRY